MRKNFWNTFHLRLNSQPRWSETKTEAGGSVTILVWMNTIIQSLTLKVEKPSSNHFSHLIQSKQESTFTLWHHTLAIPCCLQWIFTWCMQSATTYSGYHWQYNASVNLLNILIFCFYWKCSCVQQLIQSWIKHFLWPKIIFPCIMEMHLASGWNCRRRNNENVSLVTIL